MSQVIRITDELYKRLEAYTVGFDTPSNVIERILDAYEGTTGTSCEGNLEALAEPQNRLQIIYQPETEEAFKEKFIETKKAYIKIFYLSGEVETKEWNSPRFTTTSKVSGNLRSGYLRNWKEKGIYKAQVSISPATSA